MAVIIVIVLIVLIGIGALIKDGDDTESKLLRCIEKIHNSTLFRILLIFLYFYWFVTIVLNFTGITAGISH